MNLAVEAFREIRCQSWGLRTPETPIHTQTATLPTVEGLVLPVVAGLLPWLQVAQEPEPPAAFNLWLSVDDVTLFISFIQSTEHTVLNRMLRLVPFIVRLYQSE